MKIRNKKIVRTLKSVSAACAALLAFSACSNGAEDAKGAVIEEKIVRVHVQTVEPQTFVQRITLTASAKADKEVTIASETLGRVSKIGFEKGDQVKEGQPLIWLEDSTLRAEIAQAEVDKNIAALDYRKFKALADKNANVSQFQLEQSRLRLEASRARLTALSTRLSKLTIKAPISGHVVTRETEVGAIVSPGLPLSRIVSIRPIKVLTGIPEVAIADFSIGKEAVITFDAYPDREYKGKVGYLSPEVNRKTRIFNCELTLPNENMTILPEMSAKVTFIRKTLSGSILIPQTAVLELTDGHAVFVVDKGNVARLRKVGIEDTAGEMALVISGVKAGDRLVTLGQRSLIEGDRVEVVE